MTAIAIARASAALLFCMAAVVSGEARAQNYDGAGLLRFGVFGQAAPTHFDVRHTFAPDSNIRDIFGTRSSASEMGWGGGVSYGYDLLLHHGWILGVEGDIGFDTLQADHRSGREFRVDYLATVRGRFGAYVRPDLLLYGTAGVAFVGVGHEGLTSPVTGIRFREDHSLTGWTAGGGAELEWHGITFFGEYLFAGYGSFTNTETVDTFVTDTLGNNVVVTETIRNEGDVDQHVFRLGVKFIIGHDFRSEDAYVPVK